MPGEGRYLADLADQRRGRPSDDMLSAIPKGVPMVLVLASGSRDPKRFRAPDRFDPARQDNRHLGFGSGIHICYGAPLARVEAQIALTALLPHLSTATLVEDPPPTVTAPSCAAPGTYPSSCESRWQQ